ncbi:MAG: ArsR family transcriptional regulator [Bacteroidota bacterium]
MLNTLITSRTRIKLLIKFFLNNSTRSYLRDLEGEFGESTNAIRVELNRFEKAGLLHSEALGNKKIYRANTGHPLYSDIHSILLKYTGIDQVIAHVVDKLGGLQQAWLIGDFAKGNDSANLEFMLVGENVDVEYLDNLVGKAEKIISKGIHCRIVEGINIQNITKENKEALLLWEVSN